MGPETLGRQSPLWQKDLEDFGPWAPAASLAAADGTLPGRTWEAAQSAGGCRIIVCGPCSSAMDVAWELSRKALMGPWDSVLAVSQQAGRGQHQRSWLSPAGNIYAAWRWPNVDNPRGRLWEGNLSLLAGYILADCLLQSGLRVKIKWPNDLLLNDRKIGGILLEQQRRRVVAGIGLNLATHPEDHLLGNGYAVRATSLRREGINSGPLALWRDLAVAGRQKFLQIVESMAPEEWLPLLNQRLAWIGRPVLVKTGRSESYPATVLGLAADGGLMLSCGQTTRVIYSGSLIPA